jgi:hypothetical protein
MKTFIFITAEGFTYQPGSELPEPDIENCQVIGFGRGKNIEEAFEDMICSNNHLLKTSFSEIIGLELKSEKRTYLSLGRYKKNGDNFY